MDNTNREFFAQLEIGRYVEATYSTVDSGNTIEQGRQYIWLDRYLFDDQVVLFDAQACVFRWAELDARRQFTVAWQDAENYKRATPFELQLIGSLYDSQQQATLLQAEIADWRADGEYLNSAINTWATDECLDDRFDHETRLWAKDLRRMSWTPREFEYEVSAMITVSYLMPVRVKATTAEQANDKLCELSAESVWHQQQREVGRLEPQYDMQWSQEPTRLD